MSLVIISCRRGETGKHNGLKIRTLWVRIPPTTLFQTLSFLEITMFNVPVLDTLNIRYALTGSRFFGISLPTSDWDFLIDCPIEHFDQISSKLLYTQFYHTSDMRRKYTDSLTLDVYENAEQTLHLQLCRDFVLKFNMQELLRSHPMLSRKLTRPEWNALWTWARQQVKRTPPEQLNPHNIFGHFYHQFKPHDCIGVWYAGLETYA